jgi:glycosyltransferase involved in cell wall biosynthesis
MEQKRCRVLYVEKPTQSVGGSIISLYELVRGLDMDIFDPVVLLYGPSAYRERFEALGVKVLVLNEQHEHPTAVSVVGRRRDIAASLSRYSERLAAAYREAKQFYQFYNQEWPLARRIAGLIKAEAIDLVHHNGSLPGNRTTVLAARLAHVPQVCHVRMLHDLSIVDRFLARFVDSFVYISRAVEAKYQSYGISPNGGQVIYNPIDTEAFSRINGSSRLQAEFDLTDQDVVISNIGRLDWWKGHEYFLEAIAKIVQLQPHVKALIVGEADLTPRNQAYFQQLQQLVGELQLRRQVVFTGFQRDIPAVMAVSNIVVHSASEPEPFGRVVVEGMAAGRPVIATAAGGVLDIIEDKVNGLLVPPKDAEAMAQAIQELIQNPNQARLMGQRAQQEAQERFSAKHHVAAVQQLYRRILFFDLRSQNGSHPSV